MLEDVTTALTPHRQTSPAPGERILWGARRMNSELKWQKVIFSTSFSPHGCCPSGLGGGVGTSRGCLSSGLLVVAVPGVVRTLERLAWQPGAVSRDH